MVLGQGGRQPLGSRPQVAPPTPVGIGPLQRGQHIGIGHGPRGWAARLRGWSAVDRQNGILVLGFWTLDWRMRIHDRAALVVIRESKSPKPVLACNIVLRCS